MENKLEWDLPPATQEEAVLDPYANTAATASLPDDVAQKRALKTKIAFTGVEGAPGYDEILNDIKTSREDRLRNRLSQSDSLRKMKVKQDLIREVVDKGDVSPEATTFLQGLSAAEITGDQGIIEKKYAEWRVNMGLTSDETGTVDEALSADPEGVNARVDASVDRIYRKERAQAAREELDALYQQTGILRGVTDFVSDIIPGFTMMEDRNVTPDNVQVEGLTPGEARRSQIRDLFAMPSSEFDATLEKLKEQAKASGDYAPVIKFLDAVNEYAYSDAQVDNAFALLSAVELVPGVGFIGDAGLGLGKAGASAAARSTARSAAKEAVEGAARKGGSREAAKAAGEASKASGEAPRFTRDGSTPQQAVDTFNEQISKEDLFGPDALVAVDLARVGEIYPLKSSGDFEIVGFVSAQGEVLLKDGTVQKVAKGGGTLWDKDGNEISLNSVAAFRNGGGKKWVVVRQPGQPVVVLPKVLTPKEEALSNVADAVTEAQTGFKPTRTDWTDEPFVVNEVARSGMPDVRGKKGVAAILYGKAEKGKPHQIYINEESLQAAFDAKMWAGKNGVLPDGARAFPEDAFKSKEEFKDFLIQHELAHIDVARREGLTLKQMEDEVTREALARMGRKDLLEKMYPEIFARKKAPGVDPDVVPAPPKVVSPQQSGTVWEIDGKSYSSAREVDAAYQRINEEQGKRLRLLSNDKSLQVYASDRGVSLEEMRKLIQANYDEAGKLALALKGVVDSEGYRSAKAAEKTAAGKIKFTDKTDKRFNPETGMVEDIPHVVVDIPNPRTGGTASVQVPATPENLTKIYADNVEKSAMAGDESDLTTTFVAHGDAERAAFSEATQQTAAEHGGAAVKDASVTLARKLPTLLDPTTAVIGRAKHNSLNKLVNKLTQKYKAVLDRQAAVNDALWKAWNSSSSMGALRWSDDVFEAVKDSARAQMDKYVRSPSAAVLDVKFLREWETGPARLNKIVYSMGNVDGGFFGSAKQAETVAKDFYGLADGAFSVESLSPGAFTLRVEKVIDETDPDILKHAIQTDTKTPVSFANSFTAYLRGSAGLSSEMLQKNLAIAQHHAKALHEAFMVAAKDIGTLSKKELRNLDALMEAKRDVEKIVVDPVSGQEKKVRGEWFNSAAELERTYKRAFGEYPSENVTSAYFTMRQMYDFDLMHRNYKLYAEKARIGIENAKLHIPIPDDAGGTKWLPMKKGVEVKFVDELPEGNADVLILNGDSQSATLINTAKSGTEGIKALKEQGYKILQIANPDQRPLKMVNDNYVQFIVARDVERIPLTPDQLSATAGGHVRYKEGFYVKQPRFETTSNGDKLYLGDRSLIGASSQAEAAKHAGNIEIARQLMVKGDFAALKNHLESSLPWTVGQFEELFRPKLGPKGEVIEEALLDKDTPLTWVADGQGVNDAAKTHASELRGSFTGVRDTIDDPTNLYGVIGKKYTGEKDFALSKIVRGEGDKLFDFDKARMISPLETLEQAWAEISRSMATDNMKIQAATNWVEEAADILQTPIEELRRNPWAALNNPQWNRQYGDVARIRTLDAQRRQIIAFLGQKDELGSTLDWMRNKLLNGVFNAKGQRAADFVDDHVLPNVKNPLAFMRSFAFHTKMGFFNPVQLFLQMNTMLNTWAITGNPARVGSSLAGVSLMQMSRVNRTPEVLSHLSRLSEKMGWKPGEWLEMDELFHKLSLHIVEGEVGTLDIMTNPKMFQGVGGMFLDKGLVFFREGERSVRMNAWAVAFKEFRDANPTKVLNNSDINSILRRQEILSGNMTRGSSALWQKGLTGPMTQFWGYQARIMEQLLGKQLTRAEKLRLGGTFAAMYGIPVSFAAATMFQIPGWSTDDIRQYALENGIDVNSGLGSVAMNGIPAELIRWMTSDENGQNGLQFDIGGRYGPGGLTTIKTLLEAKNGVGDALVDLAFGASGSITRDFFKQVLPDNWDIIESASNAPKLALQDYANMFSTISTVNNTTKLYWALTTHKSLTKDGLNLGDKSPASAWVTWTTGLDEQRFKDTFLKIDSLKDLKTATDELGKEYVKLIRQARLSPVGSKEREYKVKKARALLEGMDPKDVKKFVKQAIRASDSLETSVDQSFQKKF